MIRALSTMILLIALSSCGTKEESAEPSTTNETAGNPLTAPVDYLGAVGKAKRSSEKTIETVSLNQAVNLFHASEGRFPKELNELVTGGYLPSIPEAPYGMKIQYDAASGKVSVVQK